MVLTLHYSVFGCIYSVQFIATDPTDRFFAQQKKNKERKITECALKSVLCRKPTLYLICVNTNRYLIALSRLINKFLLDIQSTTRFQIHHFDLGQLVPLYSLD
jgi:hypothetical protein